MTPGLGAEDVWGPMRAEQVTAPVADHGEGAVWITGTHWPDGLYWVDLLAGDVLHLGASGAVERRHVGESVSVIRPRTSGGMVYALSRGLALDDGPGTDLRRLPELWDQRQIAALRLNDGGCDPSGAFYCGAMSASAEPGAGEIYRIGPDGSASIVETGWTVPNGLEWSPDGATAFHADTTAGRVDAWSWDPVRGLHDRRRFIAVDRSIDGSPDGLTVDRDGGVWVAFWGGSCVRRYAPDGALAAVVELPVAQVSSCVLGGPARDRLYITTSRHGLGVPEPAAGAIFAAPVGVVGVAPRAYAG